MTPYTLRGRVTTDSLDEIVNQTSAFQTSYPTDVLDRIRKASSATERVESLWSTARFFHARLQEELVKCPYDNILGLLPYVSDYISFYQKKIGKEREATFEVSNLGVFKANVDSLPKGWRLEGITFTQGAQPIGAAFNVNCACLLNGPLTIAITWQDMVVQEDIVDAVSATFKGLLHFLQPKVSI